MHDDWLVGHLGSVRDTMTDTRIDSGAAATVSGIVARLERRLDQSRRFGRDVDQLFRQLDAALLVDWSDEAPGALQLAIRAFIVTSQWATRAEQSTRSIRVSGEISLTCIYRAVARQGDGAAEHAEELVRAWSHSSTIPRHIATEAVIGGATPAILSALDGVVFRTLHQKRHAVMPPLTGTQASPLGDATLRDYTLLLARIRSRDNRLNEALDVLADEPISDVRVPLTYAAIYCEHDRPAEAIERLRRSAVLSTERALVREWLAEALLRSGARDEAVEQLLQLLHETLDVTYWEIVCDVLNEADPERLVALRAELAEESPALYVEILIADGDVEEVARVSNGKTFSHAQLWRIGDFLAQVGSRKAARVYERAINLQGAVSQSKAECASLGQRIEGVLPYFASIERPTKPARLAKELLAKQKNNVPLRRELERVFGGRLK